MGSRFRRLYICGSIAVVFVCLKASLLAVDKDKAMYVGGTISAVQEKAEGKFNTQSENEVAFSAGSKGSIAIPYATITSLEYGQKAGRRVAVGILVSPWALFSKKAKSVSQARTREG